MLAGKREGVKRIRRFDSCPTQWGSGVVAIDTALGDAEEALTAARQYKAKTDQLRESLMGRLSQPAVDLQDWQEGK